MAGLARLTRSAVFVLRIGRLSRADEPDVRELLKYLRPWNLEVEGNWMGREWLRLVAMQALSYLGSESATVESFIKEIRRSTDPQWRTFDDDLIHSWMTSTDCSCLVDPYSDFLRNVDDVLDCIGAITGTLEGKAEPDPRL